MNQQQLLLIQAMEECDEISQRISKALRFGLDEIQPEQELTNAQRIMEEFTDLIAVMEMIGFFTHDAASEKIEAKQAKIIKYLQVSREQGILDGVTS